MLVNRINNILLERSVEYSEGTFIINHDGERLIYNPVSQKFKFINIHDNLEESIDSVIGHPSFEWPKIKKYRIEITESCNANCSYCIVYQNPVATVDPSKAELKGNMKYKSMPIDVAASIVEKFNEEVGKDGSIMIIGGEPLINWSAVKVFLERSKGRVNIYTNAIGITDEIADFIAEHNGRMYVSLDGADTESNRLRILNDGRPMFSHVLNGYRKLKDRSISIAINSVLTNNTVEDLRKHVEFFVEELRCKTMGLAHPHYTQFASPDLDIDEYVAQLCGLFSYAKNKGLFIDQITKRLQPIVEGNYRIIGCKIAGEQRTFNVDGSETLCTKLDSQEITKSLTLSDIQEKLPLNSEYCHNRCIAEGSCGGGCYFDGRMFGERTEVPVDERECRINIGLVKTILDDMFREHRERGLTTREEFYQLYKPMLVPFK